MENGSDRAATRSWLDLTRRGFLAGSMGLAGALALGGTSRAVSASAATTTLPSPSKSGIEHIVVVTMENRSFDHFLGWLPGSDGQQAGLSYSDQNGIAHQTYHLTDFQGCAHPDPDHSYQGGLVEYDDGACDGWLRAGHNDEFAIGYYSQADLAFFGQAAPAWTVCDGYFAAILAETYPNRIFLYSAQTDRLKDSPLPTGLPTILDRLAGRGVSHRYYFSDVPFLSLWGTKYLGISRPLQEFLLECQLGTLPHVSFVDPSFLIESQGTSGDDHPHGDIRTGEAFLNQIYRAVTRGRAWSKTLLIVIFDEWGGFFEHVPPPDSGIKTGKVDVTRRGFRVPCLLVSPWSPRGTVGHGVYDHTSILKLIEWRWTLLPLTKRDNAANNLAELLDFSQHNLAAPQFNVPTGPFGGACPGAASVSSAQDVWMQLQTRARREGWPV